MALIAQPITVLNDEYSGQILQLAIDQSISPDNFTVFEGSSGKKYLDISSRVINTTIPLLRSFNSSLNPNIIYKVNYNGCPGDWILDISDTTNADNTGTIIVTSFGQRLHRVFNGNINALWFGVSSTNADNTLELQSALNEASLFNNCDVELFLAGTYNITANIIVPGYVKFLLGTNVIIQGNGSNYAMFRIQAFGRIEGGMINLGSGASMTGIFIWAGETIPWSLFGGTPLKDIIIIGNQILNSRAIYVASGVDENMNPLAQYQEADFISYDNVNISKVDYGIVIAVVNGEGILNGHRFKGNITATRAITLIGGSSHQFTCQIESEQIGYVTPTAPIHYIASIGGQFHNMKLSGFDFAPASDNNYAIIGTSDSCLIDLGDSSVPVNIYGQNGYGHESGVITQKTSFPAVPFNYRFHGDLDNILFYAHKKYTCSTTSTTLNLPDVFAPIAIGGAYSSITDAPTASPKQILIVFPQAIYPVYYIGLTFNVAYCADYCKIEYNNGTSWVTVREESGITATSDFYDFVYNVSVTQIRVTVSLTNNSPSVQLQIFRIFCYTSTDPQSYLPCGGGTVFGNINLNGYGNVTVPLLNNSVTTDQTSSQLNAAYPNVNQGQQVYCPKITTGAQLYTFYDSTNKLWTATNIQPV